MILTDQDILQRMRAGHIQITPFNPDRLGSNSYDLSLGEKLIVYTDTILDVAKSNQYEIFSIPREGIILQPGELYLGSTVEYTRSYGLVPQLEGKSSLARLGMSVHLTAGFGDIGFEGHWTLEVTVVKPVRIYAHMPVAQIYYMLPLSNVNRSYANKIDAKYSKQGADPVPSLMWKNFPLKVPAT